MSRIQVTDLPTMHDLTPEQLKDMFGAGPFKPGMESLEDRVLLTGNIDLSGGVLTIDGDMYQDVAHVRTIKDAAGDMKLSVDLYSANDGNIKIDPTNPIAGKGVDHLHKEINLKEVTSIVLKDFDGAGDYHLNKSLLPVTDRHDLPDETFTDDTADQAAEADVSLQELSLQRDSDNSEQDNTLAGRMAETAVQQDAESIANLLGRLAGKLNAHNTEFRFDSGLVTEQVAESTEESAEEASSAAQESAEAQDAAEQDFSQPFAPPTNTGDSKFSEEDQAKIDLARDFLVGYGYSQEEVNDMTVAEVLEALDDAAEHILQGNAKDEWIYASEELESLAQTELLGDNGAIVRNTDGTTSLFVDGKLVETVGPQTWQDHVASWVDKVFGEYSDIAQTAERAADALGNWINEHIGEGSEFEQTIGNLVDAIDSFVQSIVDHFDDDGGASAEDTGAADGQSGASDTSTGSATENTTGSDNSDDDSSSDDDDDDDDNDEQTEETTTAETNDGEQQGDGAEDTSGTPAPDNENIDTPDEWFTDPDISEVTGDQGKESEDQIELAQSGGVTDPPETDDNAPTLTEEQSTYNRATETNGDDSTEDGTESRDSHPALTDYMNQQQEDENAAAIEGATGGHVDGGREAPTSEFITDQQLQDILIQAGGGHTDPPKTQGEDGHLPPTELTPPQVAGPVGGVEAHVETVAVQTQTIVSEEVANQ